MRIVRRILIILASVGWLVPLCASFAAIYHFLHDVVWPQAAWGQRFVYPFHPIEFADEAFYFSMAWLGAVIVGWTIRLTRDP